MPAEVSLLNLTQYASLREEDADTVSELVRGVVVREPRPGCTHGRVQVALAVALGAWAREHGASCTVESGYILGEDPATVRGPDVAVVLEPRSGEGEPGGWVRGAPDLAVEVLSPSDTSSGVQRRILDYLEAGTRLVWVVDPAARTVMVHRLDGSATRFPEGAVVTGEGVLAGLDLEVEDLFD